jgi:hypothetical protein
MKCFYAFLLFLCIISGRLQSEDDPSQGNPGDPPVDDCDTRCRLRHTFGQKNSEGALKGIHYHKKICVKCTGCTNGASGGATRCCRPWENDEYLAGPCREVADNKEKSVRVEMLCRMIDNDTDVQARRIADIDLDFAPSAYKVGACSPMTQ